MRLYGIGFCYEEAYTVGVTGQMNYYSHFKLSTPALFDAILAAYNCLINGGNWKTMHQKWACERGEVEKNTI